MPFYRNRNFWVYLGVAAAGLLILQQFWHWEVDRVEVPSGKFLVRIHRWGKDLPPDEIVALDESYKGIMQEPLAEGRHFLNPLLWTYKMYDLVEVPTGQCLVLTRKFGQLIPPERLAAGDLLAGEGERGIVEKVLMPGKSPDQPLRL